MKLSEELSARGFIYQHTGETLEEILDGEKRIVYHGADPTADSLHIGNLVQFILLRHLARAGHRVVLLIGGGTGLIGDPRDTEERPLIDEEQVQKNAAAITRQAEHIIGENVTLVNNAKWLTTIKLIDFLREIGKHFTINSLIKKEIVHKRLESESPLSYTEFAYPLLQAYDFLQLYTEHGCDLQTGGSDQWGNITAGVELVHKKLNKTVYAITTPLIIDKVSGRKFGKSEGNAVWLDPQKTSPFSFYQFWLNVDDANLENYLKIYTPASLAEIDATLKEHKETPDKRIGQKKLAREVTELVHGNAGATAAERVSEVLFGAGGLKDVGDLERDMLLDSAPTHHVHGGESIVDVLIAAGFASSKREAREFIQNKAVSIDGEVIANAEHLLNTDDFTNGIALLKRGKRNACVLTFA